MTLKVPFLCISGQSESFDECSSAWKLHPVHSELSPICSLVKAKAYYYTTRWPWSCLDISLKLAQG